MSVFAALPADVSLSALSEDLTAEPSRPHSADASDQFTALRVARPDDMLAQSDQRFEEWRVTARRYADHARDLVRDHADSAAVLVRLAQAEHLAGDLAAAADMAAEALARVARNALRDGRDSLDIASAISAGRLLVALGHIDDADAAVAKLPHLDALRVLRASIAIDRGELESALQVLRLDDSPAAASLRGFVLLRTAQYHAAIRELRKAWNSGVRVADDALNMALAFWSVNATRKAVSFARQASRLAPGRKDISFTLLEFLLASDQAAEARAEIDSIKQRGYTEPEEFIFLQAQVALKLQEHRRGLTLMKRAASAAKASGNNMLAAEIEGNLAYLELAPHPAKHGIARERIGALIAQRPTSVVLVELFALLADRVHHRDELTQYITNLTPGCDERRLYFLRARAAVLTGDFDEAVNYAGLWVEKEPYDVTAVALYVMWLGQIGLDWPKAACEAERALTRFGGDRMIVNNAAYALALAGRMGRAMSVIGRVADRNDYYLVATRGLVELSCGRVEEGLRSYRDAATLADRDSDGDAARALMTLHQALAVHQLGLMRDEKVLRHLSAGALPTVPLPDDWQDRPDFVLLHEAARRRGWLWPLAIG